MLEYQNAKTILLNDILLIGLKKFLLSELKTQFHGYMLSII